MRDTCTMMYNVYKCQLFTGAQFIKVVLFEVHH